MHTLSQSSPIDASSFITFHRLRRGVDAMRFALGVIAFGVLGGCASGPPPSALPDPKRAQLAYTSEHVLTDGRVGEGQGTHYGRLRPITKVASGPRINNVEIEWSEATQRRAFEALAQTVSPTPPCGEPGGEADAGCAAPASARTDSSQRVRADLKEEAR